MHPDSYQRQHLLEQVRRLHGCGQTEAKHINTWFTRYRASVRKKSIQDDDNIRACSSSRTRPYVYPLIYVMILPNSVHEFHIGATRYTQAIAAKQSVPQERNDGHLVRVYQGRIRASQQVGLIPSSKDSATARDIGTVYECITHRTTSSSSHTCKIAITSSCSRHIIAIDCNKRGAFPSQSSLASSHSTCVPHKLATTCDSGSRRA